MTTLIPDYYPQFKCISDQCNHNCCIGWEIDIDPKTLELYRSFDGKLGEKLKKSISLDAEPHFITDAHERCPFLNSQGLCEIILKKGEGALCDICTDHPRFRNEYEHFEEIGLGLCCEEAAKLIITHQEKFSIIPSADCEEIEIEIWEASFLKNRSVVLNILQDRSLPFQKRLQKLKDQFKLPLKSAKNWVDILLAAEKMEPQLDEFLNQIKDFTISFEDDWHLPAEQLAAYFIYRHLNGAIEDGQFEKRIAMALGFTEIILLIAQCRAKEFSLECLIDTARLFSAEIEYSDQNIDYILSKL